MKKILSLLWFLPALVVLGSGAWLSINQTTAENVVQKAKSFGEEDAASIALQPLSLSRYDLEVQLDQNYQLTDGGQVEKGNFREGDVLEIPYTLKGIQGKTLGSLRMEISGQDDTALLAGFTRRVRSCETPWSKSPAGTYTCAGPTTVVVPGQPLTIDSFPLTDPGEILKQDASRYYLIQIEAEDSIILPVDGYRSPLEVQILGTTVSK